MAAYFVNALRANDPEGDGWRPFANAQDGAPTVITYALMTEVPPDSYTGYGDPQDSFHELGSTSRALVQRAMTLISSVANARYVESTEADDPLLLIGSFNMDDPIAGYANYPATFIGSPDSTMIGELWLDTAYGDANLTVMLHELGHTLGLKHPFDGTQNLPESEDRHANTVMSYDWSTAPTSMQVFDVIALQSIYGPAERRMGDNIYVFGRNKVIWDGGGHDLVDASDAAKGVTLSLEGGTWNHIGARTNSFLAKGQVWLGDFTTIEDACGSTHADNLSGNSLDNVLWGQAGSDRLDGREGDDVLLGGKGRDVLKGGLGADHFVFGTANSSKVGSARDVILDLDPTVDRIDLSAFDLADRGTLDFTGTAPELRIVAGTGNLILAADLDGDGTADLEIKIRGLTSLDSAALLL